MDCLHSLIGTKLKMSSAYHPETDGSTERANRTVGAMLRQCVSANQKDWVTKLPAIEFAINNARSETTGYAPFFLNTGRMPRSLIWDNASPSEYPGVRAFALKMKQAVMSAHDSILEARVKQTRDANRKRRAVPFQKGDLVYLSTKNIAFPKGLARKLNPKYIGPYLVMEDFGNGSFKIELPDNLKARGIHNVFHASLLRVHVPNDDRLFPGRAENQVGYTDDNIFQVKWKSGDITWLPYEKADHLDALGEYFDALGISDVSKLRDRQVPSIDNDELDVEEVSEVRVTACGIRSKRHPCPTPLQYLASLLHSQRLHSDITMNTTLADRRIALMNLDHSPDSDLWVEIRGDTFVKNVYTSSMVHMYISTDAKVRNGTFDICHDPITPGYFEFADTINRSCKAFNSPVRMVVLPEDRVADKIIQEGSPILFDHLFSHNDIYRDHLAATQHPSPTAVTHQVLGFLGLGNMSIVEAKGYIVHLKAISKHQAKFEESMEEKRAKKRMAEIEGGESSKKLRTDATGMPSLQAFDSILAAGIVRAKKEIASKKKSMKGKGKATSSGKSEEEFPTIKDLEKAETALDELMGDDDLANFAADDGYLI